MSNTNVHTELQTTDPYFQSWVKGLLHDSNISNLCITFTKSNGDVRTIRCTNLESQIPTDKLPKGTSNRAITDTNQRVFDLDKQEWRSFKWDSVKEVKFEIS